MEIYLVRHTATTAAEGVCYGQSDLSLQEPVELLFQHIKKQIPNTVTTVYSSPLKRCTQLAQYLRAEIKTDARLKEINFGQWENQLWSTIKSPELTHWMNDFVHTGAPEGESFTQLYERVLEFIEDLHKQHSENESIVIVAHAGTIRCFLCFLLDIPLLNAFKMPLSLGSISKINLHKDKAWNKLVFLNQE